MLIEIDGEEIRPTISCGAAQARDNDDAAAILQRADAALYSSKCAGRNQSHWHDGHRCVPIIKADPVQEQVEDVECVTV